MVRIPECVDGAMWAMANVDERDLVWSLYESVFSERWQGSLVISI